MLCFTKNYKSHGSTGSTDLVVLLIVALVLRLNKPQYKQIVIDLQSLKTGLQIKFTPT